MAVTNEKDITRSRGVLSGMNFANSPGPLTGESQMRKLLSALAAGAFAVMLSAPAAAHAASPADPVGQRHAQWGHAVSHDRDDDGWDCEDDCYRDHHRGLVGRLIAWLV